MGNPRAVLAKLDGFRGASRFTTWAYKFALREAGVRVRRRAWQGREVPRLNTTRGALYKTLHDARRRLRAELAAAGLEPTTSASEGGG